MNGFYAGNTLVYGDFARLNNTITLLGYPSLRAEYAGASFGITKRPLTKKSYSVVKFTYLTSVLDAIDPTIKKYSQLSLYELYLGRNFDLLNHPRWMLYPFFGEGIGYSTFTLYDNISKQSFAASASNLSNPTSKTWSSGYLYFNCGLGVERKFKVGMYDFSVGLSGGYRLALSRFSENNPSYSEAAPIGLSGVEWNLKIRFEIWKMIKNSKGGKSL